MFRLDESMLAGLGRSGPSDPIEHYRRPLVGRLFRERINLGLGLLPAMRYDKALEIGYGAGAVQLALAPGVRELHGVDLDAEPGPVEAILRSHGCRSELRRADARDLPYEKGAFDLVVCFSVIEHIREFRGALAEMARVLAPGGRLLLGMPAVDRTMEICFQLIGVKGIDDHHVTTPADVRAALDGVGLAVEKERHLDVPFRRPLGIRLYHNWLLHRARVTPDGARGP